MWSAVHVGAPEPIPSTPVVPAPIPSLVQIAAPTAPRQLRPSPGRSGLALREPARRRDAARDPPSIRRALPSMPAIRERDAPGSAGGRPTRFVAVLRLKVCPPRRSSTASRQVRSSCCSSRSGRPRNAEKFGFSPGPRSHFSSGSTGGTTQERLRIGLANKTERGRDDRRGLFRVACAHAVRLRQAWRVSSSRSTAARLRLP